MTRLVPRMVLATSAALVCGSVGGLLGALWSSPFIGGLLGATLAVMVVVLRDTLRGNELIEWLRGSQENEAPRDTGIWGELGYRVERAIRSRELALAQERNRLTQFLSAIEASPNGVMLLDDAEQIEWCNSVAADHFGLDPQRDRRQRVTNLVRAPAFVSHLQAGEFDEAVVFPEPRGKGLLSVLVKRYGEGMKLVISLDITERERSEAMRRDFVANVSHEIRTPLTVLSGFIETMRNLDLSEAERQRVLLLMTQQSQRMQALVSDLLTLAQLEGSPRPPAERWVSLRGVLVQVEADARALSAGRHVIEVADDGGAQIAGAENELLSAVTNLVNNAVRYTPAGGHIEVRWRVLPSGAGELAVVDSGPGIAREHLSRLTERFYRVDGSRSRDTGGTGLGLAIVKHVAQRHGGTLEIQSELGKGSVFRLVFPAPRVRAGTMVDAAQPEAVPAGNAIV